jgi:hypothetical protein
MHFQTGKVIAEERRDLGTAKSLKAAKAMAVLPDVDVAAPSPEFHRPRLRRRTRQRALPATTFAG